MAATRRIGGAAIVDERSSRTERARLDPVKAGGVHYTPPELARFIADAAVDALDSVDTVRVLDPACGAGELLLAAHRSLVAAGADRIELVGFDIDAAAVAVARARLGSAGASDDGLTPADFLHVAASEFSSPADASEPTSLGTFDLVVTNPPYVRTQHLGADAAQRLAANFQLTGRVDLYHAFVVAITACLREGGALGLVCPNRFLSTLGGRSLRGVFASEYHLRSITDFGDTKLFEAAVLPAVVVAVRTDAPQSRPASYVRVYHDPGTTGPMPASSSVVQAVRDGLDGHFRVHDMSFNVRRGALVDRHPDVPWRPSTTLSERWLDAVRSATAMTFADVGRVRVGIKTTADDVFIRSDWDEIAPSPELSLLRPLITHHGCEPFHAAVGAKRVLYPYDLRCSKRTLLDLTCYPDARAYLELHRARLEARTYVIDGGREWFEIWVPQRPADWVRPKLVFPDISDRPRFGIDRTGAVVNGDCYWLALPDDGSTALGDLMLAVANSRFSLDFYDLAFGNQLYSGRRRFITQYVAAFPIPDPTSSASRELVRLSTLEQRGTAGGVQDDIDALVYAAFGVGELRH